MSISINGGCHMGMGEKIVPTSVPRGGGQAYEKIARRDVIELKTGQKKTDDDFARALAGPIAAQVLSWQVPASRVEELSRQVSSGQYRPDPDKIARRLLGQE